MAAFTDLTGLRFGRLTAKSVYDRSSNGGCRWLCRCDCGALKPVDASALRRNITRSCGCLQRDHAASLKRTHGLSTTPEYRAWIAIKQRCFNADCRGFPDYGGRGITMSAEWQNDFLAFLADVKRRPSTRHSIDRVDNDDDYKRGNCRWALPVQQVNNRRNNVVVRFRGKDLTLSEASRLANISHAAVRSRMKRGADPQVAFDAVAIKGGLHV